MSTPSKSNKVLTHFYLRDGLRLCWVYFFFIFSSTFVCAQKLTQQASDLCRYAAKAYHNVVTFHGEDSIRFYQNVVQGVQFSLRSDSIDNLPNNKGRIKPKFNEENVSRLLVLRPLLINAGVYFANNHYPDMGIDALKLYLSSHNHSAFRDEVDERGAAYYQLSVIYFRSRGFQRAEAYADRALEYNDVALPAAEMKVRCMRERMTSSEDSLHYAVALKELYSTNPTNETYFSWMMQFYARPTVAHNIDHFIDEQLEKNPHSPVPWILKGELAMHNRHWPEAIEAYKQADAIDATSVPVIYNIGLCLIYEAYSAEAAEGDGMTVNDSTWYEAAKYLERVRAMDPRRNKVDWVTPLYTVYDKVGLKGKADELKPLIRKQ